MGAQYDAKVKMFFLEHLHEDEEIRYILDGQGFFDVRDGEDHWLRILVEKDDLIILPAGLYHRFTTDSNNVCCLSEKKQISTLLLPPSPLLSDADKAGLQYIKAMRLFKDEPKWTPMNRDPHLDSNASRKSYLDSLDSKSRMT